MTAEFHDFDLSRSLTAEKAIMKFHGIYDACIDPQTGDFLGISLDDILLNIVDSNPTPEHIQAEIKYLEERRNSEDSAAIEDKIRKLQEKLPEAARKHEEAVRFAKVVSKNYKELEGEVIRCKNNKESVIDIDHEYSQSARVTYITEASARAWWENRNPEDKIIMADNKITMDDNIDVQPEAPPTVSDSHNITLALMTELLAAKFQQYRTGSHPNATAIAKAIEEMAKNKGITKGQSDETVRKRIGDAQDVLKEESASKHSN